VQFHLLYVILLLSKIIDMVSNKNELEGIHLRYLIGIISVLSAAEIAVLLISGNTIGVWPTIFIIMATGVIGAYLMKREGLRTIRNAQEQLRNGQIPGNSVLDGICILVGGILLVTPGFITDIAGLLLFFPPTRKIVKLIIIKRFSKRIMKNNRKIIK
jgi:UPF0716 protein FxsA